MRRYSWWQRALLGICIAGACLCFPWAWFMTRPRADQVVDDDDPGEDVDD